MHLINVIKKPILTEKSYLGFEKGTYAFKVDKRANKTQIKKVFEEIFDVKVESVRTMNYNSKDKRLGKFVGKLPSYKKAIITLKEGQKLDLLTDL